MNTWKADLRDFTRDYRPLFLTGAAIDAALLLAATSYLLHWWPR